MLNFEIKVRDNSKFTPIWHQVAILKEKETNVL